MRLIEDNLYQPTLVWVGGDLLMTRRTRGSGTVREILRRGKSHLKLTKPALGLNFRKYETTGCRLSTSFPFFRIGENKLRS